MRYHRTARLVAGLVLLVASVACGEAPDPVAEPIASPTQLATSQPPSLSPSPSSSPDQTPAVTAVAPPAQGSAPTLIADREILVSISQQHMWAYEHGAHRRGHGRGHRAARAAHAHRHLPRVRQVLAL